VSLLGHWWGGAAKAEDERGNIWSVVLFPFGALIKPRFPFSPTPYTPFPIFRQRLIEFITRLDGLYRKQSGGKRPMELEIRDNFNVQIDRKGSISVQIGAGDEVANAIRKKGRSITVSVAPDLYVAPEDIRQRGGSVSRQRPASVLYQDLGFQEGNNRYVGG
jgi:hypothetical protein